MFLPDMMASAQAMRAAMAVAAEIFTETGLHGDFLKLKETGALFRNDQHFPSPIIDRGLATDGDIPGTLEPGTITSG